MIGNLIYITTDKELIILETTMKSIHLNTKGSRQQRFSAVSLVALLLSLITASTAMAQETQKGPGGPIDPPEMIVQINVPMPVEKLNEQYTSTLYYSLPYAGGTVTFAAFYDPVDPHTGLTDLEYLNNCLAYAHADTLMTFTSASTNLCPPPFLFPPPFFVQFF